jgi:hypothetical protein
MTKDPVADTFHLDVGKWDRGLGSQKISLVELPNITRKGRIPALSLLNFDVAACVAIFWL